MPTALDSPLKQFSWSFNTQWRFVNIVNMQFSALNAFCCI